MVIFFIFGLLIGSFSNVLISRAPKIINGTNEEKINLFFPRSHCLQCKKTIKWYDLVPILSWIILNGKCRYCKTSISIQYPIIELTHAIAWAVISTNHLIPDALIWCLFTSIIINLAIIDAKHFLLPNVLIYPLALSGLIISATHTQLVGFYQSIIGGILGYLILYVVGKYYETKKGRIVLGGGDAKFAGALGIWFGPISIPYILMIASITAIIITTVEVLLKKQKISAMQNKMIPLGLYLSIAAIILYQYNHEINYRNFFYNL